MKDKVEMTQELIGLLHNEGWLSDRLKQEYEENRIGDQHTYQDLMVICGDYDLIDKLFEDKIEPEQIVNVTYKVCCQHYGENTGSPEVFNNLIDAIQCQYKHSRKTTHFVYFIEVDYEVKK